jgi:hypothetical protein
VLHRTVHVLLEDLLDPHASGLDAECLDGATEDMLERIRRMPRYMGLGIAAMTVAAAPLARLPRERRLAVLRALRGRPLVGDFVELYEKMGTFTYFARLEHGR